MRARKAAHTMKRELRIYFATDIHGSEACFRKFLAAAKVYEADVIMIGGDFAGKALVPVLSDGGMLNVRVGGQDVTVGEEDWDKLRAEVTKGGFYPVRMTGDEVAELEADPDKLEQLFKDEIRGQVRRWSDLAAERLDPSVRCIITPGNDDPAEADAVLAASDRIESPEFELCDLGPLTMVSVGVVPVTPWNTERECSEDELAKLITEQVERVPAARPMLLNLHCPPFASSLDDAPELDATLKPMIRGGRPSIVPVGSHAVRDAIKRYQPVLGLHGHIHESRGVQKIGKTLCINPGSDYSSGVLKGVVLDIAEDGTCLDFLLTTG